MISSLSMSSKKHKESYVRNGSEPSVGPLTSTCSTLTLLDAEAGGPLLQGDVIVAVGVALLKEAGGAVLHGNERSPQGGDL